MRRASTHKPWRARLLEHKGQETREKYTKQTHSLTEGLKCSIESDALKIRAYGFIRVTLQSRYFKMRLLG